MLLHRWWEILKLITMERFFKFVLIFLISLGLKAQAVQNTCSNTAYTDNASATWTLGTIATPMTIGHGLVIGVGVGCNRTQGFQSCNLPIVSDTCQDGSHNNLQPIYGIDPSGLVATFFYYTCNNTCAGVDTISVAINASPGPPNRPLSELMATAVEFISPDNSSANACQDNPNLPSGFPSNQFNQCFSTGGNSTATFLTPLAPNNFNPPNFRTTGPFTIVAFTYNRAVNANYDIITGNPAVPDFTHQSSQASPLNPQNVGQMDAFVLTQITSTSSLIPPYYFSFHNNTTPTFTPYQANCILVFDKVTATSGSIMKKRGLLY